MTEDAEDSLANLIQENPYKICHRLLVALGSLYRRGLFIDQSPVVIDVINKTSWVDNPDSNVPEKQKQAVHFASKRFYRRYVPALLQTHENLSIEGNFFRNWPSLSTFSTLDIDLTIPDDQETFNVSSFGGIDEHLPTKRFLKPKFNTLTLIKTMESKFPLLFNALRSLTTCATHKFIQSEQQVSFYLTPLH